MLGQLRKHEYRNHRFLQTISLGEGPNIAVVRRIKEHVTSEVITKSCDFVSHLSTKTPLMTTESR